MPFARGLLFDMDGTLVDSRPCIEKLWQDWAAERGVDYQQIVQVMHGRRGIETISIVAPHLDANAEVAALIAKEMRQLDGTVAIAGAAALLQQLAPEQWAVVTSAPRELALAKLAYASLPLPKYLIGADDVREGKPHPAPYQHGATLLGLSASDCIAFEDAGAGIASAHHAGAAVCLVTAAGGYCDQNLHQWTIADYTQLGITQEHAQLRLTFAGA
ncbi:HAD-IA family hydrolase [Chitinibacter tainanensis]|uniref:HAD-IA family hydrolase n=1 Tax=Chitinibacter tainanensis TaxID=230667 RepID=UPI0023537932|nr:HAD-IA family hydrolase [Chitinibacter tainanensis]